MKTRILTITLKIIAVTGILSSRSVAQDQYSPLELPQVQYVRYSENHFDNISGNEYYDDIFLKFDSLLATGRNKISIVHIGGSHIQADIYTHRIRQHMQSFYPGVSGARGFIFPFSIAETNNPSNYRITCTGKWQTCLSTKGSKTMKLGLAGITVSPLDTVAYLNLSSDFDSLSSYDFNRVKVFCNELSAGSVSVTSSDVPADIIINEPLGYIEFDFSAFTDTLQLKIGSQADRKFELYGLTLENDDPGVMYNSIGVNGATLQSYLKCELFVPHLKALDPDWVIISIGTNDGYTRNFDKTAFRDNYISLIKKIRAAAPEAAIMLTVPNDSYFNGAANPNTREMEEIIRSVAQQYSCGVWDFYRVMGGFGASSVWFDNGLMNKDHVHFSKAGYILKGDLFFSSFLEGWSSFMSLHRWTSGITK
jgi:lysophospholipase L1-like esterase